MQLQEAFPERVVAISLNLDFDGQNETLSPELEERIRGTLTKLGITCRNLISGDPMGQVLRDLEIFGLPAAIIFDKEGQLHKRFEGSVGYDEVIVPEVEKLLE